VLRDAGTERSAVIGVGLGLPAPIDTRSGQVGSSSILPGWVGVEAAKAMSERLGLPVYVDNDANLGALAEVRWGAARGCADAAYIKISAGVGAGLVIGGRLYRGAVGTAGEIGHTSVDEHGRICRCGNRGCLETVAAVPVMLELLAHSHGQLAAADVVRLAQGGDMGCRRVIEDVGRHVGVAVANLCNLINPEMVVVGGELAQADRLLLDPLADVVRRRAIPSAAAVATIAAARLGSRAHVLGALALVLDHGSESPSARASAAGSICHEFDR